MQESLLWAVPWAHHVILMDKVLDLPTRRWYMEQTLANAVLPAPQSDLARQSLKDPYIFDFLALTEPFHERELEIELVRHLEKFLLELGQGFAFVGRQRSPERSEGFDKASFLVPVALRGGH